MYEIGIDCEPMTPRPDCYLPGVLKDTGIVIDSSNTTSRCFGAWTWNVPEEYNENFKEHRELMFDRLKALFKNGHIRGAIIDSA